MRTSLLIVLLASLPTLAGDFSARPTAAPRPKPTGEVSAGRKLRCSGFDLGAEHRGAKAEAGLFEEKGKMFIGGIESHDSATSSYLLAVRTRLAGDKPAWGVGPDGTDVFLVVEGVRYRAIQGDMTENRVRGNKASGEHQLTIENVALFEVDPAGPLPRCVVVPTLRWKTSWRAAQPAPKPAQTCLELVLPNLHEVDEGAGWYQPAGSAPYVRSAKAFRVGEFKGGLSFVVTYADGWPRSIEEGGVHLKLVIEGREFRAVAGAMSYPQAEIGASAGTLVARLTNLRLQHVGSDVCVELAPFDLTVAWSDVDARTRVAQVQ